MLIRDAQVEDAAAMGRLMVTAWLAAHRRHIPPISWERRREQWTPEVSARGWERCLRERNASPELTRACYLVAEDSQGSIVGVAAAAAADADPTGTLGEIGSLYVHPDHQTRGIGARLVRESAARLEQMGVRSLHVGVLSANVDAQHFYEALGAQHVGDRHFDEDGVLLPERIYAWPDITHLLGS